MAPPPLPPGWTEHVGPGGQVYYHNAQIQESTYVRPLPAFFNLPLPATSQKKKEKPLVKTPIPGTGWLRVKTTEGNVFYSHKLKKESVWIVPEEIKEAVEALEREAHTKQERQLAEEKLEEETKRLEIERIKSEVQDAVKRKADDATPPGAPTVSKRARTEAEVEVEVEVEVEEEEEEEEDDSGEEEEWQREAAAQLAIEAEEENKRLNEEAMKAKEDLDRKQKGAGQLSMPQRVDLSLEEAKALFKTLLREKDVNPLHPWDTSLPLFVSDPRYVLIPSVSARREAFDEYCRDCAREQRQKHVQKEKDAATPKEEFERLLREEVMSARASWGEFRRTWKKNRRFWGWGRDDREREKRFKEHTRELGERKRAAAQNAETDFFALLKDAGPLNPDSIWKDVKRTLSKDPRYDAVGSASLREELFNTFLKARASQPTTAISDGLLNAECATNKDDPQRSHKERKERALKEREDKVRTERGRLEADIGRSRIGLNTKEGEMEFKTLLTDAVRDPQTRWDAALPQLKTDPRFTRSPLPPNQQLHLFRTHVEQLRTKQLEQLHILFQTQAPSLASPFSSLPLPSLLSSLPATKLEFDIQSLEHEFEKWQRERTNEARIVFDEMLGENSFVEFWGRLNKIGGEGVDGGVKADHLEEDMGEGGGGKVDMKALAKGVDVHEVERVLKNDKRYINFDHVPEQRERWIRDYLSRLSAPKLSVHLPTT